MLKSHNFKIFMTIFVILILSHNKEGADISMRKDITIEKLMLGGEKVNSTPLHN